MRRLSAAIWLSCGLVIALAAGCTRDNINAGTDDLGGGDDLAPVEERCGDGVVSAPEDCDDGNGVGGDGCENDCTFTCATSAKCDDLDPCNGAELCDPATHVCGGGTALADGADCGSGRVCRGGVCVASSCGDGVVTGSEECDDSNATDGDGCDSCRYSCVVGDVTRDCTPADACAGQGTCNPTTHTCTPGTPVADNSACPQDAARYCKSGACRAHVCNDGNLEPGEQCDDGNLNQADGCKTNCTYSCVTPATDCGSPPACQKQSCTGAHVCLAIADAALNGTSCGSNLVCTNGSCAAPGAVCGNGVKESGEACDFGGQNGPNAGCEIGTCTLSCTGNSCDDGDACSGVETCVAVTVNGQMGQRCQAGTPLANGTSCTGGICVNGKCAAPRCGDGVITSGAPLMEECEPPNTASCDANCKGIVCGNGRRDSGEQCDDGAKVNTDGCDAACGFEQAHRASFISMEFNPSQADQTYCPNRRLNGAISPTLAGATINSALATGVTDGSISILFKFLGLDDLTGTADANGLKLGALSGAPRRFGGDTYSGNMDLDWWYDVDTMGIDAVTRQPLAQLDATLSGQTLAATGSLSLKISLAGAPAELRLVGSKLTVGTRLVNTPTVAAATNPPGHLVAEHLSPTLTSFSAAGEVTYSGNTPITTNAGKLCGNVTAASLAQVPVPEALGTTDRAACLQNAGMKCGQCYLIGTNSLLDVIVGGCTVFGFLQAITATQPDQQDASFTPAGGPFVTPYRLTADPTTRVVNGCQDASNPRKTVPLADCLKDAAYSSFFKFTTRRVILK